jgi:hypothetical protein
MAVDVSAGLWHAVTGGEIFGVTPPGHTDIHAADGKWLKIFALSFPTWLSVEHLFCIVVWVREKGG